MRKCAKRRARGNCLGSNELTSFLSTLARFSSCATEKNRVFACTIRNRLRLLLSSGDATRASQRACRACSTCLLSRSMCAACSCTIRRNTGACSFARAASVCRSRTCCASMLCVNCAKKSADSNRTIHLEFWERADRQRRLGRASKNPSPSGRGRGEGSFDSSPCQGEGRERVTAQRELFIW